MSSNDPHSICDMGKYDVLKEKKSLKEKQVWKKKKEESKYLAANYDVYLCTVVPPNYMMSASLCVENKFRSKQIFKSVHWKIFVKEHECIKQYNLLIIYLTCSILKSCND